MNPDPSLPLLSEIDPAMLTSGQPLTFRDHRSVYTLAPNGSEKWVLHEGGQPRGVVRREGDGFYGADLHRGEPTRSPELIDVIEPLIY